MGAICSAGLRLKRYCPLSLPRTSSCLFLSFLDHMTSDLLSDRETGDGRVKPPPGSH